MSTFSYIDALSKKNADVCKKVDSQWASWDQLFNKEEGAKLACNDEPETYPLADIALIENDHILHCITADLKGRYELKGFLNNCDMKKLLDIFRRNMVVEEVLLDQEEEDYISEEDHNF
jgi:hypothetical protein